MFGWWQLKYFLFSPPKIGEDEPNLTSIFSRWVAQPPTSNPEEGGWLDDWIIFSQSLWDFFLHVLATHRCWNQQTNPKKCPYLSGGGLTSPSFNSTWSDFVGVVLVVLDVGVEGLDLFGEKWGKTKKLGKLRQNQFFEVKDFPICFWNVLMLVKLFEVPNLQKEYSVYRCLTAASILAPPMSM